MDDNAPVKVVGWGFIPLPGERKRWESAEATARFLLQLADEAEQRTADEEPSEAQ